MPKPPTPTPAPPDPAKAPRGYPRGWVRIALDTVSLNEEEAAAIAYPATRETDNLRAIAASARQEIQHEADRAVGEMVQRAVGAYRAAQRDATLVAARTELERVAARVRELEGAASEPR